MTASSRRRPRVAIVTTSYPRRPGDCAGHFVETEARRLAETGSDVTVFAPGRTEGSPLDGERLRVAWLPGGDAFGAPGALFRLRERPLRFLAAIRFVRAARRALRHAGPFDRVIAHWLLPSAWPAASALPAECELEVVVHGSDARLLLLAPRGARRGLVEGLLDRGATFRFVSAELRDALAHGTTSRLFPASRVEPCPIDLSCVPSRDEARARLGIAPGDRLAVVVGRLVPSKDPERAVTLARAHASRVVVIGTGPLASRLGRLDPAPELRGGLPRSEALEWIRAADLLVSASRAEGSPTVVREARALGTPVLAVPVGDLREWAARDPGISLL
ncbi:MAG TPA: glycosyltransferase family 4 protein [Polyangiaceae bacterium]|nr:glycosyltransferase family 4 protein [Polyangiaceae bacterium]